MPTPVNVAKESTNIAHEAELGTPKNLEKVHKELQHDMKNYSAADYGKLLNGIRSQNQSDLASNDHLPLLSLYDSGHSGVPDSVAAQYSDGTIKTADPPIGGQPGAGAGQLALLKQVEATPDYKFLENVHHVVDKTVEQVRHE